MRVICLLMTPLVVSCGQPCKGIYTERVNGELKKFEERRGADGQCYTDNLALSQWERTNELRLKLNVRCTPQPHFATRWLTSANNFYSYRNSRILIELNASTGEYRKLTLADGKQGQALYSRLVGCFYERDGHLLLDTRQAGSDQFLDVADAFTYTQTGTSLEAIRYDDSSSWNYTFCPILDTPEGQGWCDLRRNGNYMFEPTLTAAQQSELLTQSKLIRKEFNWITIQESEFSSVWANAEAARTPASREDYRYAVSHVVDTPLYVDQGYQAWIRRETNVLPDLSSTQIGPICYFGQREVPLTSGGTATIYGEICFTSNGYEFTPQP